MHDRPASDHLLILISHNYYDHLEYSAIQRLVQRFPEVHIMAPLKVGERIAGRNIGHRVTQFDWRRRLVIDGIEVTCSPARHASCRTGFDFGAELWCSWLVRRDAPGAPAIYFPGDTAIGPHFREVREYVAAQGGRVEVAMMPIGPQEPEDMMRVVHMNPVDAFDMTKELGARTVFPIHWGAFAFGTVPTKPDIVPWNEIWQQRAHEVEDARMCVLNPGEFVEWNGERFDFTRRGDVLPAAEDGSQDQELTAIRELL